jgi:MoaA/NifB/PqqE/SkfB family radical SAM enzyme
MGFVGVLRGPHLAPGIMSMPNRERIAVIFLQSRCDMSCLFCATDDGVEALDPAGAETLVCALHAQGVTNVILGGGEPMAWRHGALGLARFAKSLGLTVQIGTNGIALPAGFAEAPGVDRFILPLESVEPAVHDVLRLHPGGHHRIIVQRLEALGQAGKSATVSTVVTSRNLPGLGSLGRYLSEYHARYGNLHAWHLYKLLHVGRGGSRHGPRLAVEDSEYHAACDRVRRDRPDLRILKRPDMLHSTSVGFFWRESGAFRSQSPYPILLPG